MHPADIQAAITKAGHTQESLIKLIRLKGKTPSMISHSIHSRYRSRPIESLISEVTGIPLQTLWPNWYPRQPRKAA